MFSTEPMITEPGHTARITTAAYLVIIVLLDREHLQNMNCTDPGRRATDKYILQPREHS
jgi:hypothetical protein